VQGAISALGRQFGIKADASSRSTAIIREFKRLIVAGLAAVALASLFALTSTPVSAAEYYRVYHHHVYHHHVVYYSPGYYQHIYYGHYGYVAPRPYYYGPPPLLGALAAVALLPAALLAPSYYYYPSPYRFYYGPGPYWW
jgi:hypothetical protein